jgi:hypothetical protein
MVLDKWSNRWGSSYVSVLGSSKKALTQVYLKVWRHLNGILRPEKDQTDTYQPYNKRNKIYLQRVNNCESRIYKSARRRVKGTEK